eukprot:m.138435 g.138435  ORF g.138435 m.138435 type:complete len:212 (+) comp14778_c1_seq4:133-768(+)
MSKFGQVLNVSAIGQTFKVIFWKQSLAIPHMKVADVSCIDFDKLRNAGIEGLAFDKDNCLTEPYEQKIHPKLEAAWADCKRIFGDKIVIYSNHAGSKDDTGGQMASEIEESLGVGVLRHTSKKPRGGKIVSENLGIRSNKIAFIGDRVLTDVVHGNLNGMFTILTDPLTGTKKENTATKFSRSLESYLLSLLLEMKVKPPDHKSQSDIISP